MVIRFKSRLVGERVVLKRTRPTIRTARTIFEVVDANRHHLAPWFKWVEPTKRVEDSLKYLFDKEDETREGKKIEYGIHVDGEYIGNIAVFDIDERNRSGELGYWLSSGHTRKGYMTEAVRVVEDEFFRNKGFHRLTLKCDTRNQASIGVARKCGYVEEGTLREDEFSDYFGGYRDTVLFSKLRREWEDGS